MMRGTILPRHPDRLHPPRMGRATVEKIAVNAVSGGLPRPTPSAGDRLRRGALDPVIKLKAATCSQSTWGPVDCQRQCSPGTRTEITADHMLTPAARPMRPLPGPTAIS